MQKDLTHRANFTSRGHNKALASHQDARTEIISSTEAGDKFNTGNYNIKAHWDIKFTSDGSRALDFLK